MPHFTDGIINDKYCQSKLSVHEPTLSHVSMPNSSDVPANH